MSLHRPELTSESRQQDAVDAFDQLLENGGYKKNELALHRLSTHHDTLEDRRRIH